MSVGIGFVKYQMLVAMNDANRLVVAKSMAERCIELLASLDIHACLVASLLLSALSLSLSLFHSLTLCSSFNLIVLALFLRVILV